MTVVLIIGILLSIAYVAYAQSTQSAAAAACRSNQRVLEDAYVQAVAAFKADEDVELPDAIDDLRPYVTDIDAASLCPLDETPLSFDAATGDVSCSNHP